MAAGTAALCVAIIAFFNLLALGLNENVCKPLWRRSRRPGLASLATNTKPGVARGQRATTILSFDLIAPNDAVGFWARVVV